MSHLITIPIISILGVVTIRAGLMNDRLACWTWMKLYLSQFTNRFDKYLHFSARMDMRFMLMAMGIINRGIKQPENALQLH